MLELYQAEWCPHSRRVRQRLTELGLPFVARQVEAEPEDRERMREAVGTDEIPVIVLEDHIVMGADEDEIITWLDEHFEEHAEAEAHRAKAAELTA